MNLPKFRDPILLAQALTHRSYANEHPSTPDNERLEYLGDAVLTFLSGDYLYRNYPDRGEDWLTQRRAVLVDKTQLARFAEMLALGTHLRVGRGIAGHAGTWSDRLLSSAFEALVGALYLDGDRQIEAVRSFVEPFFDSVPEDISSFRANPNAKGKLQEWVQTHIGHVLPEYKTRQVGGTDDAPEFVAEVYVPGYKGDRPLGIGRGGSKKIAERKAAEDALAKL